MTEPFPPFEIDTDERLYSMTFSVDGTHLVSGHASDVRVWRLEDGVQVAKMDTSSAEVNCLAASHDGKWIAGGTERGNAIVWSTKTYEPVWRSMRGMHGHAQSVDFSPDSTKLAVGTGNWAQTVAVFDIGTGKEVLTLEHRDGSRARARYSPLGDRIATATSNHVRVWDAKDGHLLTDIPVRQWQRNTGVSWFQNHLLVVSGDSIKEFDANDGSTIAEWPVCNTQGPSIALPLAQYGGFIAYAAHRTITCFLTSSHSQFLQLQHTQDIHSIALSNDARFIAIGERDGKIAIQSLSRITQPNIHTDAATHDAWKHGQLENAVTLLTAAEITAPRAQIHHILAIRGLIRTRLRQWDAALVDAEEAIKLRPSAIGFIAKSVAHVGKGEKHKAYQACDIAFGISDSSSINFLLLIKAIIVFMAGEHVDAMSRMDDLIATAPFTSMCHMVQAYMHLLLGNSQVESGNYKDAVQSFKYARSQIRPHSNQALFAVSLIFGWKFDDLNITVQQRLCEALYSLGHIENAIEFLLELAHSLDEDAYMREDILNWISKFTQRCLATPGNDGDVSSTQEVYAPNPTPLLEEWAKATLAIRSWGDALVNAVAFVTPRFAIYCAIYDNLEVTDRLTDAAECLLQMESEFEQGPDSKRAKWIIDSKHRCRRKLEELGDNAMNARQHDKAIVQYSAGLSLNLDNPQEFLAKRSKARANMGLWKDALNDANEVITLDPSSPMGYERKHAALRCARHYGDAQVVFETMLLKMSQSPDPEMQKRSLHYVQPAQTEKAIHGIIQDVISEFPLVLINTSSGRLLDKAGQASWFESQPIFHELVTSMTTDIDHVRIEDEVGHYYRYATFSHTWQENEPLYDKVVHIVVYELDDSPTHFKLQMFCKIAKEAGLHWAWSDTCCINKGDPWVLQEALVSMYQWYQCSTMTIVSLCDVPSKRLADSVWNSRAWALQEYHASKVVRFYNKDWTLYKDIDAPNHKEVPEIIKEMEEATGVSEQALMTLRPGLENVREKLRLASTRHTTLVEDAVYSLFGIFSLSQPVIYGEGDQALGRLLAQLLTSAGDSSILAWTGRSGSFNSCLPAQISVFSSLPTAHIPPVTATVAWVTVSTKLHLLNTTLLTRFYDRLNELRAPFFIGQRLSLPCIVFELGQVVPRSGWEHEFCSWTDALGTVDIKTEEDISQFKSLYLVYPWIDSLLDREPVRSTTAEEIADDRSCTIVESASFVSTTTLVPPQSRTTGLASRLGLSFGVRSLLGSSTPEQVDKRKAALRILSRLRLPFGVLLLTPDSGVTAYKRVAAESLITVHVRDVTPSILNKLVDSVRVLDVL